MLFQKALNTVLTNGYIVSDIRQEITVKIKEDTRWCHTMSYSLVSCNELRAGVIQ